MEKHQAPSTKLQRDSELQIPKQSPLEPGIWRFSGAWSLGFGASVRRGVASLLITKPVDLASLAAFRFLFGLLMAAAMIRFVAKGWVRQLYVEPAFHFPYPGFEWIRPWPDALMHAHCILLALLALGVALGLFYRICIILFFLGFTYVELIDQTAYLNHYYLISLLSGLLVLLPAHRAWSLDVWRKPQLHLDAVPAWCLNLLRFQVAVVYVFAGLAKFNSDWLLHAQPLRIWLAARSDLPVLGPWLQQLWVAYAASWFGAIFDTGIIFLLLFGRTRKPAYVILIFFHITTWLLFNIGMFPWIMIVAATLLFPPDWPRHWLARLRRRSANFQSDASTIWRLVTGRGFCPEGTCDNSPTFQLWGPATQMKLVPKGRPNEHLVSAVPSGLTALSGQLPNVETLGYCRTSLRDEDATKRGGLPGARPHLLLLLGVYVVVQLALPLRPYFSSQPVAWTCDGFNCAWRVMIAEKTGYAEFYALNPATGKRRQLSLKNYLIPRQEIMMAQDPYLIRLMARRLAEDLKKSQSTPLEITADAFATVNGRPSQRLINPHADLAGEPTPGWILPLLSADCD